MKGKIKFIFYTKCYQSYQINQIMDVAALELQNAIPLIHVIH